MTTISGAHEEVSIYGTGIAHIPLIGKPLFYGLTRDDNGQPTATVKDGALTIETDDIDLLIAWRNAFQHAVSSMVIWRQRGELPAVPPQPVEPDYAALGKRAAVIAGLRALTAFLEEHPDVPIDPWVDLQYSAGVYHETDKDARAEVDRIAALIGTEPQKGDHYLASRAFGPVKYIAVAVPSKQDSEATS